MKTKFIILMSATTLSCVPVFADALSDNSNQRPDRDVATQNNNSTSVSRDRDEYRSGKMDRFGDLRKASKIIGEEVTDDQGQKLGKVKDLALDLQNGRVVEVIMATGGVLGIDARLIAVPPSSFTCDKTMHELRLNLDKEQLRNSPEFKNSEWNNATVNSQVREVYQRYGVQPYFAMNENVNDVAATNYVRNSASDKQPQDKRGQLPYGQSDLGSHVDANRMNLTLGYVASANHLMGTTAWNNQNEKLGKVNNFIIDLSSGRVVEVILASGGFLGLDEELSAVPPQSFHWNADNTAVTLDSSRDDLKNAPHFKSSDWGYANEPAHINEVYTTYHVPAYFNDTAVDNTAQNVRDRSGSSITPIDQGNNQPDIDITAQIRKAVVADSSLSTDAKNVKIITSNGRVTLRGVVDTQDEKRTIADAAARVAGTDHIDNLLQIRGTSETPGTTPANSTDTTK